MTNRCGATPNTSPDSPSNGESGEVFGVALHLFVTQFLGSWVMNQPWCLCSVICVEMVGAIGVLCSKGLFHTFPSINMGMRQFSHAHISDISGPLLWDQCLLFIGFNLYCISSTSSLTFLSFICATLVWIYHNINVDITMKTRRCCRSQYFLPNSQNLLLIPFPSLYI